MPLLNSDQRVTSRGGAPLSRGMSLLFVALALLRGLVYAAVVPPWQAPDEHGHFEYAWLVSQHGPGVGPEAISPQLQRAVLASMAEFDFWRFTHQPTPAELPDGFLDPQQALLSKSRPQVGDERPIYYWLVGGLLRALGTPDVLTSLYIGRFVSVALFAAAVGLTAYGARALFPGSISMEVLPPAFVLSLPMLGQMGSAFHSDALGVLAGTLFFVTLIPVFRDGLTWRRGVAVIGALGLALLSKKTTLFLLPTGVVAVPIFIWTRGICLPRWVKWGLVGSAVIVVVGALILRAIDVKEPLDWIGSEAKCGATWSDREAFDGQASFRLGDCSDGFLSQGLTSDDSAVLRGSEAVLSGWIRSAGGTAVGYVSVLDDLSESRTMVSAGPEWRSFTITHPVLVDSRWVAVRLSRETEGNPLLFDDLVLTGEGGQNLIRNGSAEQRQSLLLDLLSDISQKVGAPRRFVERLLSSDSWSEGALRQYWQGVVFCFHSFWGSFGWLALPIPSGWYAVIAEICGLSLVGNLVFLLSRLRRSWQTGLVLLFMTGLLCLAVQTFLPLVNSRVTYWMPQGRYTFSALFAIALIGAWGWHQILPSHWERWTTAMGIGLMAGFDWLCLIWIVIPYFYGG